MTATRIICLANSRKNRNRCIAGITLHGTWVRPVSDLTDGGITWSMRAIRGAEPQLLDVLDIPLGTHGPDFGHQPENRLIKPGKWTKAGSVNAQDIATFCEKKTLLLHTNSDRIPASLIAGLPEAKRYSLQLIRVSDARFYTTSSIVGRRQIRAAFTYVGKRYDVVVTDPIIEKRASQGDTLSKKCFLTVSMGGPYEGYYYKFIAGVIEE